MMRATRPRGAVILLAALWLLVAAMAPRAAMAQAGAVQAQAGTANPHGTFNAPCADCHRADAWRPVAIPANYKHAEDRFPLEGAHAQAACTACHTRLDFTGVSATCTSCHRDIHQGEFGATCARCHSTRSFLDATQMRRLHQLSAFPLTGSHMALECDACHSPRAPGHHAFVNLPTNCASCHMADYQRSRTPPHASSGFPTTCETCHATTAWSGVPFDHATTQFPLTGAHRAAACTSCHADGVYRGKPTTCVSCHQADYNRSASPPHAAAGFPTTCQTCHTTTAWTGAPFDHNTTQFALTGAHRALTCANCHADGVYRGKPTTCVSCHQAKYSQTTTPPHAAAGYSTTCETCHNTTTWNDAVFDHATTLFPLTGAHRAVNCAACHADGVYRGKPTTCVSCHQTKYNQTTSPPHAAAGFPTMCETCHNTTAWPGAVFDHNATMFPLAGAHRAVSCAACHADGVYRGKSTACVSCHQTDFNRTTNPAHAPAGFPSTCESCHTVTAWTPATFNHSATAFPLTGAHSTAVCSACHGDGVYRGKPTTCVSCHQTDYAGTTNPNHAAAQFPTDCASCHTTTQWLGATFDHDGKYFPIYSGTHRGQWSTCATCHTNPANYALFDCLSCHGKSQTDNDHRGRTGYVYASQNCYACHPRGKAG